MQQGMQQGTVLGCMQLRTVPSSAPNPAREDMNSCSAPNPAREDMNS